MDSGEPERESHRAVAPLLDARRLSVPTRLLEPLFEDNTGGGKPVYHMDRYRFE